MEPFKHYGNALHPDIAKKFAYDNFTEQIAYGEFHDLGVSVNKPSLKVYGREKEKGLHDVFVAKVHGHHIDTTWGQLVQGELMAFINLLLEEENFILTGACDDILFDESQRVAEIRLHSEDD